MAREYISNPAYPLELFSPDDFTIITTNRLDGGLIPPFLPTDPGYEIWKYFMARKKAKGVEDPLDPLTDDPLPYEETADSVFEKYFYLDRKSKPSEAHPQRNSKKAEEIRKLLKQ